MKLRLYQQKMLANALKKNTLVVLPTGLGKTAIAITLAKLFDKKILMLAPTKPLCIQHEKSFKEHHKLVSVVTGEISPEKREKVYKENKIIISTPQSIENDLINSRLNLEEYSLVIFDEAHHATGDYSYVWLAKEFNKTKGRILGLTASPGTDLEKVQEICDNLFIEFIDSRKPTDSDVAPYVKETSTEWVEIEFPKELDLIRKHLKKIVSSKLSFLKNQGYTSNIEPSKTQILKMQSFLQSEIASGKYEVAPAIIKLAQILKIEHAIELLESQSIKAFYTYLEKLFNEAKKSKSKSVKELSLEPLLIQAYHESKSLLENNYIYPKLSVLENLLNVKEKVIIFTNFRDTAKDISSHLKISNKIFVGQAKKQGLGLTQKKQAEIINEFRESKFQILIATSVAEEGLDIPKVDKVIFYEPTASAIRNIQRRGRTGRLDEGQVQILCMKNTRDMGYKWSAHHKEKRMYDILSKVKLSEKKEVSLDDFDDFSKPLILADTREKDNKIAKELINLNCQVNLVSLESADYVIGECGIEFKLDSDFVNSLLDGRLFKQLQNLKENFTNPLVMVQGRNIYNQRNVHPNAIRGAILSIAKDIQVPIIYTEDYVDTANYLKSLAKMQNKSFSNSSKMKVKKYDKIDLIKTIPGVGNRKAENLQPFTLKQIFSFSHEEIEKNISKINANKIYDFFNK